MPELVDHFDIAAEILGKLEFIPASQKKPEVLAQIAQAHALLALTEAFEAASAHLVDAPDDDPDGDGIPATDSPWVDG